MTREAFLNAIRVVMALGGSTNAVLHLIAIAHEAEVDLSIDDFNPIAATTPTLADLKPSGRYVMKDLDLVGGAGIIADVALITDGRFSGGSHGIVVGHMAPESPGRWPHRCHRRGRHHHHRPRRRHHRRRPCARGAAEPAGCPAAA